MGDVDILCCARVDSVQIPEMELLYDGLSAVVGPVGEYLVSLISA